MQLPYKNIQEFLGFAVGVLILQVALAQIAPEQLKAMFRI